MRVKSAETDRARADRTRAAGRDHRSRRTRRGLAGAALLMGSALALAGCAGLGGHGGAGATQSAVDAAAAEQAAAVHIKITPHDGADNVGTDPGDVRVEASGGELTKVAMTAVGTGQTVEGFLLAGGSSWEPSERLQQATEYAIAATAKDSQGRSETKHASFTTISPQHSFTGYFTPEDGATVGVGMPLSINFNRPIAHKAAVQAAIQVSSTSGQQAVGHWFGDTRLDFRPKRYWQPGSEVTLSLRLKGVEAAAGAYGWQSKDVTFQVGRSQISTVDAKAETMTVNRDGKVIRTLRISAGRADHPTYDGAMVIAQKFLQTRMNGATVGFLKNDSNKGEYDIPDVPHAMRLTNSGTFIHGNYWAPQGVFGTANTSHGCVGLDDVKGAKDSGTDGAWFFANSLTGDVVQVVHSGGRTVQPDNGLNGWNMSWAAWLAGSAI